MKQGVVRAAFVGAMVIAMVVGLSGLASAYWSVIDLGTLGGGSSYAGSINDNGQIVGSAEDSSGGRSACRFDPTGGGANIDLGGLGGYRNDNAQSINNSDQIVGGAHTGPGFSGRACLFDPTGGGANKNLGILPGYQQSGATSINNNGQIVGLSLNYGPYYGNHGHATRFYQSSPPMDLGTLIGYNYSEAYSINDHTQIVGAAWHDYYVNPYYYDTRATLFDATGGGANIDLGSLGGYNYSSALSNNNDGQIVGYAFNSSGPSHACLFDPTGGGANIDLGTLVGYDSYVAVSINDRGQIVGIASGSGYSRACLFDPTGSGNNIDLNNLIDPLSGWTLTMASDINNNGWIVGYGRNPAGYTHAYLLLVPEPSDTSPPTTTIGLSGTLGNHGWYVSDVQVALSAADEEGGSGVATTEYSFNGSDWTTYAGPFTVSAEGTTTVCYRSTDNAGNVEPTWTEAIKIDKTPPTITGSRTPDANANGWNNSDVTVHFECSDSVSGVESCPPDMVLSAEGAGQSVVGVATDRAGNTASTTVSGINIDKTPPVVTIDAPANVEYLLNQIVLADWSATDSLSGLASAVGTVPSGQAIDTATVGMKTFGVAATDNAGNPAEQTVAYCVCYAYSGVLEPVDPDGSSVFKLGRTIPVKFQLRDAGGDYIATAIARLYVAKISGGIAGPEMEAVSTSAATTGNLFRYDCTSDQYIFNLATKTLSVGIWQLRILLDDGTSKYAMISLR